MAFLVRPFLLQRTLPSSQRSAEDPRVAEPGPGLSPLEAAVPLDYALPCCSLYPEPPPHRPCLQTPWQNQVPCPPKSSKCMFR